ncbi:CPBP family intramembrane glutamic endopeptidase [Lactococcus nasutitermitis]|uniref:CPBP family intramembrane glutamic endopeptidase n=1 Tax=Lactococcus nasutitermitis TaxID=1652957 RepID=A0ABV9JAF8_9LACT|nr:type II CAAX endopeptidase family protein [Lactococcus nasutitermitis]
MINHIIKYRWFWLLFPVLLFTSFFSFGKNLVDFATTALIIYLLGLLFVYNKGRWIALFVLSLLPTITSSFLAEAHHPNATQSISIFFLIFFVALFISYFIARKPEIIPKISFKQFPIVKIIIGFFCILILSYLTGIVGQVTHSATTENQAALNQLETSIPFVIFAFQVIFAGFFEELTYRVGIFEIVFAKHPKLAFITATVLFAFMHGPTDLYSWLTYGLMSLTLTIFYAKYRNFYLNMSIHILWNMFGLFLPLLLK